MSWDEISVMPPDSDIVGFAIKSTAPSSRAWRVSSAPFLANALSRIIGTGFVCIISFIALSPPIPGISISIVITSGCIFSSFLRAISAHEAVAITSISGSVLSISEAIFLTKGESSTIITLIIFSPFLQFYY